jgi:hypothetical protein
MLHISSSYLGGFVAANQAMESVSEIYNVECKESLWERDTENNSERISKAHIRYSGRLNWTCVEVNQKTMIITGKVA